MLHNGLAYGSGLSKAASLGVGLGREEEGLSRLSESLGVGLNLWDETLPEFSYHRNERIWANGAVNFQAAVPAEVSFVGVINPIGSGLIVVVEKIIYTDAVGVNLRLGPTSDFIPTAIGTMVSRDTRVFPLNNVRTQYFVYHGVVITGARVFNLPANAQPTDGIPLYIVLTPGQYLSVNNAALNTVVSATLMGRERPAFPGEIPGT